ncbi:unnamed protein product, partial [Ectocarpus sp. 8 AP-2014]
IFGKIKNGTRGRKKEEGHEVVTKRFLWFTVSHIQDGELRTAVVAHSSADLYITSAACSLDSLAKILAPRRWQGSARSMVTPICVSRSIQSLLTYGDDVL